MTNKIFHLDFSAGALVIKDGTTVVTEYEYTPRDTVTFTTTNTTIAHILGSHVTSATHPRPLSYASNTQCNIATDIDDDKTYYLCIHVATTTTPAHSNVTFTLKKKSGEGEPD